MAEERLVEDGIDKGALVAAALRVAANSDAR
jgi:hypothetical protein